MNTLKATAWLNLFSCWLFVLPASGKYASEQIDITADFCERNTYWTYNVFTDKPNTAYWDGSALPEGCRIEFEPENTDIFGKYTVCVTFTSFPDDCNFVMKFGIDKTTTTTDESDDYGTESEYGCLGKPSKICTTDTYQALVMRISPTTSYMYGEKLYMVITAYENGDDSATPTVIPIVVCVSVGVLFIIFVICIVRFRQSKSQNQGRQQYAQVLQQGIQYTDQQAQQAQPSQPAQPTHRPYGHLHNRTQEIPMNYIQNVPYGQPAEAKYSADPPPYSSVQHIRYSPVPSKGPGSVTEQPLQLPASYEECTYKVYDAV